VRESRGVSDVSGMWYGCVTVYLEPNTMARESVTIRLREELIERLDDEAEDQDVSRSEYVRDILNERHEAAALQEEVKELREQLDSRESRIENLEEQLARRSQVEEKIDEVALEVREERQSGNAPFFVNWWRWWQDR